MCLAAAPTGEMAAAAATWCSSPMRRGGILCRFIARAISAPGAAGTGRESSDTALAAPSRWSRCPRGPRSRASMGPDTTSSSPGSAPWSRQAPRFAERGLEGEAGWIELRLKLLADAGLIGQPNAGKSSLLGRLTRAAPKVASYPFTTVEPVLGTLDSGDRQLVLADIPGLIEGAAGGAGLGHEFLAHVERCRILIHMVDIAGEDPAGAYEAVRTELSAYGDGLELLPELVVLSKRDLVPEAEADAAVAEWSDRLGGDALGVFSVSSATGVGLDELRQAIFEAVPAEEAPAAAPAAEPEFEAEHIT